MSKLLNIAILLMLFISSGCGVFRQDYTMVQKAENIDKIKGEINQKDIYYFEPDIKSYVIREDINKEFFDATKKIPLAKEIISNSAASNNVNVNFFDEKRSDLPNLYINQLLGLKSEMVQSFMLQDHELNKMGESYNKKFYEGVFVYPPILNPVNDIVSEKLGTNFVGYFGMIEVDSKPEGTMAKNYVFNNNQFREGQYVLFYNLVADIRSGTVIYSEIKKAEIKLRSKDLKPVIYDSFFVMNQNITQ